MSPALAPDEPRRPPEGIRRAAFLRAARKRCPQCGVGALFARYARLRERCAECDLVYRRDSGAQTGTMYLTAAVTQVFAALVIGVAWIFFDLTLARFLAIAVPVVVVFCAWFLPVAQAIWVAVDYTTDVMNGERWVHPRV